MLTRAETESSLVRKLQEENSTLRTRILSLTSNASPSSQSTSTHQSRLSSFHNQSGAADNNNKQQRMARTISNPQNLNDIVPFDIPPPTHIVDDFYIIAQETLTHGQMADSQARGIRSLIRNISSSSSPVLGRKESLDRNKRRSGSSGSGRSWTLH